MKRIERFLISVLWVNAVLLVAAWLFNNEFGFNIFARSHWRYLSELQISGTVNQQFYIFIISTIFVGLVGLYILIVPWHRKIVLSTESLRTPQPVAIPVPDFGVSPGIAEVPKPMDVIRPPKLNLDRTFIQKQPEDNQFQSQFASVTNSTASIVQNNSFAENPRPVSIYVQKIKDLLSGAGFVHKKTVRVAGIPLDFIAIGSGEALVVGLVFDAPGEIIAAEGGDSMWQSGGTSFKSPAWQLTTVMQKFQTLFLDALGEEVEIHLLPFVFCSQAITNKEKVQAIWDALGIKVFDNYQEFSKFIEENKSDKIEGEDDQGVFDAFSGLVDSALQYFSEA